MHSALPAQTPSSGIRSLRPPESSTTWSRTRQDTSHGLVVLPRPTRATGSVDLLGPEHFCFMHEWGPFRINKHLEMDLFLRRLIAL